MASRQPIRTRLPKQSSTLTPFASVQVPIHTAQRVRGSCCQHLPATILAGFAHLVFLFRPSHFLSLPLPACFLLLLSWVILLSVSLLLHNLGRHVPLASCPTKHHLAHPTELPHTHGRTHQEIAASVQGIFSRHAQKPTIIHF